MALHKTIRFILDHPLNRNQKIKALYKLLTWQVISRLTKDPIIFNWIRGSKLKIKKGDTGLTGNIYTGLHEFIEMSFLLHFLRSDDLFVDVGANLGSYTVLASSVVGAESISIEPVPSTFKRLIENIEINKITDKTTCVNKIVGDLEGTVTVTNDQDTTNHVVAVDEKSNNFISIKATTLESILSKHNPRLIKIDVEGYELPVIIGAQSVLKNDSLNAVILEMNGSGRRYGFDERKILSLMQKNNFKAYSYDPYKRNLLNIDIVTDKTDNIIFIRNKPFVDLRLAYAKAFTVHNKTF